MKYRIAKKVLKNKENLSYTKNQIKKAETVVGRYSKGEEAKSEEPAPQAETVEPAAAEENTTPENESDS